MTVPPGTGSPHQRRRADPGPGRRADRDTAVLRETLRALRIEMQILDDAVAGQAGVNPRDLDVLDVIDREGPCSPSWLAERTGNRRATLTSVLARLERDGWIERRPDPSDGRAVRVASTARFGELRDLYGAADAAVDDLRDDVPLEDLRAASRVLRRATDHLRARTGRRAGDDPGDLRRSSS